MKPILSLDLSTCTGWASGPPDGSPRFGTQRFPGGEDLGRSLQAFEDWLTAMIAVEKPAVVVFEAPIMSGGKTSLATARLLYCLAGMTELICRKAQVQCREANLMNVKKFWTGHGHAKKPDMIAAAKRFGFDVRNPDEADAVAVWAHAVHTLAPKHAARFTLGLMGAAT